MSNTFPQSCLPVWSQLLFVQVSISSWRNLYENAPDCFHKYRLLSNMNAGGVLTLQQHPARGCIVVTCIKHVNITSPFFYGLLKSPSVLTLLPFSELNGTWASLTKCDSNYCSLSRSRSGHHRVIWGLHTQPGSLLLMSIRLTIAHLFSNCRKCNLKTKPGQPPPSENYQILKGRKCDKEACMLFDKVQGRKLFFPPLYNTGLQNKMEVQDLLHATQRTYMQL